jgi:exonuclease III
LERRRHPRSETGADFDPRRAAWNIDDKQSRYIEAAVDGIAVASIYLPNGNPQPGPKFEYKPEWFDRLVDHAAELLAQDAPAVLAGDYNVVPTDFDIYATR